MAFSGETVSEQIEIKDIDPKTGRKKLLSLRRIFPSLAAIPGAGGGGSASVAESISAENDELVRANCHVNYSGIICRGGCAKNRIGIVVGQVVEKTDAQASAIQVIADCKGMEQALTGKILAA